MNKKHYVHYPHLVFVDRHLGITHVFLLMANNLARALGLGSTNRPARERTSIIRQLLTLYYRTLSIPVQFLLSSKKSEFEKVKPSKAPASMKKSPRLFPRRLQICARGNQELKGRIIFSHKNRDQR